MNFDPNFLPYPSIRYPVYAREGMVATSSPQASLAGLEALRQGGNAVDAAVAAAVALTVTEPSSNGIGSDAFAIVWADGKLYGLNASGKAPANISWEIPPNGQGVAALAALNILGNLEFTARETPDTFHRQWEAMKLAFSDVLAHVTDSRFMKEDYREWLKPEYGKKRASEIGERACIPEPLHQPKEGTVYLATADGDGNMVSYIQSNYMGFGSGVVIRGTGIALQNRGADFSLDSRAPNALAPGKKSYHTIIPGFLTKDGKAVGPFGVMGGYMQPQGHVQVITNMLDFGLNPQQALDAPRWQWIEGRKIHVEPGFNSEIVHALANRGTR